MMDEHEHDICDVCNEPIVNQPWVLLNRFCVGTGTCTGSREVRTDRGEYVWSNDPDDQCTGIILHWPGCARMYIDAAMVEVNVMVAREEGSG